MRDAASGRYIVLAGGGGYNIDLLARVWALQMIPADHREKADAEANRVVDQARSLVREERLFAIEHGAEVVSFDRDFQRFIGLRSRLLT